MNQRYSSILGIAFNVTLGVGLLQMSLGMPTDYRGKTIGLLGNFNNNKTDDYRPRGLDKSLPHNISEEQIFKDFGQTCKYAVALCT